MIEKNQRIGDTEREERRGQILSRVYNLTQDSGEEEPKSKRKKKSKSYKTLARRRRRRLRFEEF